MSRPRKNDKGPSDEQKAAENFAINYFRVADTPEQRRGKFAGLVTAAYDNGLISEDTAALYLQCSVQDFQDNLEFLRSLYDINTP